MHPELTQVYQSLRAKRDICLTERESVESIFLGSSHVDYGFSLSIFPIAPTIWAQILKICIVHTNCIIFFFSSTKSEEYILGSKCFF